MTQEEKIQVLRDLGYGVQIIDGKPTINDSIDLRNSYIVSLPDNLVVSSCLYLYDTGGITSLPNNLVVGGCLDLEYTNITSLPNNLIIGGNLYLRNTKITSLPDNLVIGGSLDLYNTDISLLPNNLVIGNWIDLRNTEISSLPDNLVVGNCIIKNDGDRIYTNQNVKIDFVQKIWGDKPYCKVDGIFTEVVKRRGKVWTVRKIGNTETFYIVNDGNGHYAHGKTIKEAKADLIYKITNKDKSDYEGLTLDSVLTHEEAIQCYRVITGACSFGTRNFVENILPLDERKKRYTIAEMIRLTAGQYGNKTFAEFFEKQNN